jgi:hypothetical protein
MSALTNPAFLTALAGLITTVGAFIVGHKKGQKKGRPCTRKHADEGEADKK